MMHIYITCTGCPCLWPLDKQSSTLTTRPRRKQNAIWKYLKWRSTLADSIGHRAPSTEPRYNCRRITNGWLALERNCLAGLRILMPGYCHFLWSNCSIQSKLIAASCHCIIFTYVYLHFIRETKLGQHWGVLIIYKDECSASWKWDRSQRSPISVPQSNVSPGWNGTGWVLGVCLCVCRAFL